MNEGRISLLKKYIKEEPNNPFNSYALAMEYYETAPEESLKFLRKLLSDHPSYLPSYFKAAHLLWENENWDEANEVFLKGISIAEKQEDQKTVSELKAAYQNFQFDRD